MAADESGYGWLGRAAKPVALVFLVVVTLALAAQFTNPYPVDFVSYWAAGILALDGNPAGAYDYAVHRAIEAQGVAMRGGMPFPYPPPFLILVAPFALLPYAPALLAWVVASFAFYLLCLRTLFPRVSWLAAAFPPVMTNAIIGQNGFLLCGILAAGLALLPRRPWLGGFVLGLLILKPQLGLALPFVLLAGREWRAFAGAAAGVAGPAARRRRSVRRSILSGLPCPAAALCHGRDRRADPLERDGERLCRGSPGGRRPCGRARLAPPRCPGRDRHRLRDLAAHDRAWSARGRPRCGHRARQPLFLRLRHAAARAAVPLAGWIGARPPPAHPRLGGLARGVPANLERRPAGQRGAARRDPAIVSGLPARPAGRTKRACGIRGLERSPSRETWTISKRSAVLPSGPACAAKSAIAAARPMRPKGGARLAGKLVGRAHRRADPRPAAAATRSGP